MLFLGLILTKFNSQSTIHGQLSSTPSIQFPEDTMKQFFHQGAQNYRTQGQRIKPYYLQTYPVPQPLHIIQVHIQIFPCMIHMI